MSEIIRWVGGIVGGIIIIVVSAWLIAQIIPTPTPTPTPTPIPTWPTATTTTDIPEPAPAFLYVESNPPGAEVEVGIQSVNGVYTLGTGRMVGVTPLRVELLPSDVSVGPGTIAHLVVQTRLEGYIPKYNDIGLGDGGQLELGKTYTIQVELKPIKVQPSKPPFPAP